jgi:hypothetical protein
MLCNVCVGVLQYRQNILVPGTIDDDVVIIGYSHLEEEEEEEEEGTTGVSQIHELSRLLKVKCGHHRTSASLALSAAAECHICQPFWDQCSASEKEYIRTVEGKIASEATRTPGEDLQQDVYRYEFFSTAVITIKSRRTVGATLHIQYNRYNAWDSFTLGYGGLYVLKPGMYSRQSVSYTHH